MEEMIMELLKTNGSISLEKINNVEEELNIKFPIDYTDFILKYNGATGVINDNYIDIWKIEDIITRNKAYKVEEFFPNLVYFGSDGGGEAYAFDKNDNMFVVRVPFICDKVERDKKVIGTFDILLKSLCNEINDSNKNMRGENEMDELLRFTATGTIGINILFPPKFEFVFYNHKLEVYKKGKLVMTLNYIDIKEVLIIKNWQNNVFINAKSKSFNIYKVSNEICSKIKEITGKSSDNKKIENNKQLTIHEKWEADCESYKNPKFRVETGESQCYKCLNRIGSTFKCSKMENIPKEISFNRKNCEFRLEKKEQ